MVNDEILSDNPHLFLASFFFPLSFYFVSPPVCLFFLLTHTDLGLCTFLSLSLFSCYLFLSAVTYIFSFLSPLSSALVLFPCPPFLLSLFFCLLCLQLNESKSLYFFLRVNPGILVMPAWIPFPRKVSRAVDELRPF